jgi:hypothetical protein
VAGVILAGFCLSRKGGTVAFVLWSSLLVSLLGLFYLARYSFYGEWLPNTYFAKVEFLRLTHGLNRWDLIKEGWREVSEFFAHDLPWVTAFGAVSSLFFLRRINRAVLLLISLSIMVNLFYVLWVGGDFWPLSRFLQVTAGLAIVLAAVAPLCLIRWAQWGSVRGWPMGLSVVLLLLVCQPVLYSRDRWSTEYTRSKTWAEQIRAFLTVDHLTPQFIMGKWLKENLPPDAVVATGTCGQIPYYSELETVDTQRLLDHHLARHELDCRYLRQRNVGYVLLEAVPVEDGKHDNPSLSDIDSAYVQVRGQDCFHQSYLPTHWFSGKNQNDIQVGFVMFTRRDLLTSAQKECLSSADEVPGTLETLLHRDGIRSMELRPDLIKDLQY